MEANNTPTKESETEAESEMETPIEKKGKDKELFIQKISTSLSEDKKNIYLWENSSFLRRGN